MLFTLTPSAPVDGYGEALLPLADVKAHLRFEGDDTDEDALLGALRDAAINMVEQYTGLRLAPVTGIVATLDGFAPKISLGVGPAFSVAVTAISYRQGSADIALASTAWQVRAGGYLCPLAGSCWPAADGGVTVTFNAGYPAGQCPPVLIHAAKMMLAHLYLNREAVINGVVTNELPLGFTMLCGQYRMPVL